MVGVSSGWVAAHQQTLLPECYIEITYEATDPALQESAVVTANNETYYATTDTLVAPTTRKHQAKYAATELGLWGLDGSYTYVGKSGAPNPAYASAQASGSDGSFTTNIPTISIAFPTVQLGAVPGITITWSPTYNEWATDFRVTAYYGEEELTSTTITGNRDITVAVHMPIENYTRIEVVILGWSHPNHRARCSEIFLGVSRVYQKEDLMGYEHSQTSDLLSASLPKNEITFRLRNEDNRWNPDNPTGDERFLLERQEIRVRYGMDVDGEIEWIKGGTFWLSEWSTPSNGLEASFTARDLLEFMNEEYTGPLAGTLRDIAIAALTQANLPLQDSGEPRYLVSDVLANYSTDISGEDSQTYTISQILQLVAHAGCCVMWQDRDGVLRIEPQSVSYSGYVIDQNTSYSHPEYEFTKPLKALSVGYGADQRQLITVADRGEVQTVDNAMLVTRADAVRVGERARDILESRKSITGEYRADLRLDVLDPIIVTSKYATNIIAVTDILFSTTGGAFRGTYTGRVMSLALEGEKVYAGEIYAGEM